MLAGDEDVDVAKAVTSNGDAQSKTTALSNGTLPSNDGTHCNGSLMSNGTGTLQPTNKPGQKAEHLVVKTPDDMILQDIDTASEATTITTIRGAKVKNTLGATPPAIPCNVQRTKTVVLFPPSTAEKNRNAEHNLRSSDFLGATRKNITGRRPVGVQRRSDSSNHFHLDQTRAGLHPNGLARSNTTTSTYARKFVMDIANYDNNYHVYSRHPIPSGQSPRSPSYDTRAKHGQRKGPNLQGPNSQGPNLHRPNLHGSNPQGPNYPVVGSRRKSLSLPRSSAPAAVGNNSNHTNKSHDGNITGERTRGGSVIGPKLTGLNRESLEQTVIGQGVVVSFETKKIQNDALPNTQRDKVLVVPTGAPPNLTTIPPPGGIVTTTNHVQELTNGNSGTQEALALPMISPPLTRGQTQS